MIKKKTHAITVIAWLIGLVTYVYTQNNILSIGCTLSLFFYISKKGMMLGWKSLFKGWMYLSIGFVLFYSFFVHSGDYVLFTIPGQIPMISGVITLNSIVYGLITSASIVLGLFSFGMFTNFFKNQKIQFYFPGLLGNLSILFSFLSHFSQFFFRHRELFNKKLLFRGIHPTKLQTLKLFMHDSFFYSLEHSISYAENLELRGFSARNRLNTYRSDTLLILYLALLIFSLVLFRIYHSAYLILILIGLMSLVFWEIKSLKRISMTASQYRYRMDTFETLLIAWSLFFTCVSLYRSFHGQAYLVQNNLSDYFSFYWPIHALFFVHGFLFSRLNTQ